MTVRLVALVLLPVTVMGGLAGSAVLSSRSAAARAIGVDRSVVELAELVRLGAALTTLESNAFFDLRAEELGLDADVASASLGVDREEQAAQARAQGARAVAALGPTSPVSERALSSLDTEIALANLSPTATWRRLSDHRAATGRAVARSLDSLGAHIHDVALEAAVGSLQAAIGMVEAARAQTEDLTTVLLPPPDATPQSMTVTIAALHTTSTQYASAAAQVRQLGVERVVASLRRIEADVQVRRLERAVAVDLEKVIGAGALQAQAILNGPLDTLATGPPDPFDAASLVAIVRGVFVREDLLGDLVTSAADAASDDAQHLAATQRTRYLTGGLVAAAVALVTIGIALRLGHSISKPLRRLAGYAHAINDGQLDISPPSGGTRGPREARVACEAFTDLVATLKLLDAKANALARCEFDDPALGESLPGRLGRSLESSVTLLSGSIIAREELQTRLANAATHDALTGIGNRPAAITAIHAALNRGARAGTITALLYVDLNEFKSVNDSHGHEAGDEVLRQVASRLSAGLRIGDAVARLGGDEFVVVAEGLADAGDAIELAERLIEAIGQPIDLGAFEVTVGAAIGIAVALDGPEDALRLLGRADAAMYLAKHHERSAIEVFDADLRREQREREEIGSALAAALADPAGGGLQLHYQPVLDATSGVMVGAEALIRWDWAGHGLLAPDQFIPIAERSALIIKLDRWVLAEAARQLVAWSTVAELAEVPVAVNISGRHLLSGQLPDHVRAVLDDTGLDPHRLSVEVTETVLLTDLPSAAAELDAVRLMGVRVALDDFGTGYTSLAHLQQLPIDTIKIDRSFIGQLNMRQGSSLVRMVTELGHAIDVDIVAEGVESTDELRELQAMGADQLQGFLLCRPLDPTAFSAWAHDWGMTPRELVALVQ
jgi:diguanylate cyclase (GGDEF)-like protein